MLEWYGIYLLLYIDLAFVNYKLCQDFNGIIRHHSITFYARGCNYSPLETPTYIIIVLHPCELLHF